MNESVQDILKQATDDILGVKVVDQKKFAELLVVKCANIIWDEADKKDSAEINEGGYKILDYFGIDWRAEQTEIQYGHDA